MRCPNCGNENPDDYTFCDECGAKLTAQDGEATAVSDMPAMPATAESDLTPVSAVNGSLDGVAAATPSGPSGGTGGAPVATVGGLCPNCGAATVPGEAYCNECGAELPTASEAADMPG